MLASDYGQTGAARMKLVFEQDVAGSPDHVYRILHDRFTDLPRHIPNLESITELHREPENAGVVRTRHRWKAEPGLIPAVARPFLKPSIFEWIGHAEWRAHERMVAFTFESEAFRNLYDCQGKFHVREVNGSAHIYIEAVLQVFASRVPGMPKLLAGRVNGIVEKTLINAIRPGLAALPAAVSIYAKAG